MLAKNYIRREINHKGVETIYPKLCQKSLGGDRTGFFMGSYVIYTHLNDDETVTFTISDVKGWESATRSPSYYGPVMVNKGAERLGVSPPFGEKERSSFSLEGLLFQGQRINRAGWIFGPKSILEDVNRSDPGLHVGANMKLIITWTEPLQVDQESQ